MTQDGDHVSTSRPRSAHRRRQRRRAPTSTERTSAPAGAALTRVSTGSEGAGNTDSCEPAANTEPAALEQRRRRRNCDAVAVGGGGGVAREGGGDLLPLARDARRPLERGRRTRRTYTSTEPGLALPTSSRPWSRAPTRRCRPRRTPTCAPSAAFENPAGVAIDHSNGDIYVLDVGTDHGPGYIYKFESDGHADARASATAGN